MKIVKNRHFSTPNIYPNIIWIHNEKVLSPRSSLHAPEKCPF
jgi:hypothetical protein